MQISDDAKQSAEELNIKLNLIPAKMADELQHLDKKTFGPMKMFLRQLFRHGYDYGKRKGKKETC